MHPMTMKDPLAKLFGSVGRVKIMRLFLAQKDVCLTVDDIIRNTKTIKGTVLKELRLLTDTGFLVVTTCTTPGKLSKQRKAGYKLNDVFEYTLTLRPLLTQVGSEQGDALASKIRKTGRIKAVIVSGIFLQAHDARVDIIIVGDAIKSRSLESVLVSAEAELGQELHYAVFGTNEFLYRLDIKDKLICDVLAGPHRALVNRIGL